MERSRAPKLTARELRPPRSCAVASPYITPRTPLCEQPGSPHVSSDSPRLPYSSQLRRRALHFLLWPFYSWKVLLDGPTTASCCTIHHKSPECWRGLFLWAWLDVGGVGERGNLGAALCQRHRLWGHGLPLVLMRCSLRGLCSDSGPAHRLTGEWRQVAKPHFDGSTSVGNRTRESSEGKKSCAPPSC